ncbi:hypothetical protein [Vibrio navarrensis]|uniref:Uncharacterized protein n=1 Tax=Vibrio navarrensis TaxID=29495 RepID=A0AAJ4LVU3_9VIBR|nr:hypothetical protein I3X05_06780 [Vibrio navarrensis]
MAYIKRIKGVVVDNPELPVLDGFRRITENNVFETDSWGHWILGGSEPDSIRDLSGNGNNLTVMFGQPELGANYAKVGFSDVYDTGHKLGKAHTFVVVFKQDKSKGSSGGLVFGNFGRSSSTYRLDRYGLPIIGCSSVYVSGDRICGNSSYSSPYLASVGTINDDAAGNSEQWFFAAYSLDGESKARMVNTIRGVNNPLEISTPGGGVNTETNHPVGIGNPNYDTNLMNDSLVAEAILFDRALTAEEMVSVYDRSRQRMALRGIVI